MLESPVFVIILLGVVMAAIRTSGYVIGLRIKDIGALKDVLEILPGCALIALIVPGVMTGSVVEVIAFVLTVGVMWKTDNVMFATLVGLGTLLFLNPGI